MLAAEAGFGVLHEDSNMEIYWDTLRNSWVWQELQRARNYRPVSTAIHFFFSHLFSNFCYVRFPQMALHFIMLIFV